MTRRGFMGGGTIYIYIYIDVLERVPGQAYELYIYIFTCVYCGLSHSMTPRMWPFGLCRSGPAAAIQGPPLGSAAGQSSCASSPQKGFRNFDQESGLRAQFEDSGVMCSICRFSNCW